MAKLLTCCGLIVFVVLNQTTTKRHSSIGDHNHRLVLAKGRKLHVAIEIANTNGLSRFITTSALSSRTSLVIGPSTEVPRQGRRLTRNEG
jgi:hypothetical protein